jgi:demethylmenaquinone methyltransferase/2-methoxy-6-polyprenyl-1,4-benzoquinol methylase
VEVRQEPVLPEGRDKVAAVRAMFDTIAPRYDLVNRIMTFGLDRHWRARAVRSLALPAGAVVLDLACGTGDLCRDLSKRGWRAIGADISLGMLEWARTAAPLAQADAACLPFESGRFDGLVSGFALRNFADLTAVLAEAARVMRPGGRIALLDVSTPSNPVLRSGHALYFGHVVPRIGAALSDRDAYRYLPKSVAYLPAPNRLVEMVSEAGFERVRRQSLSGGITQLITGSRT